MDILDLFFRDKDICLFCKEVENFKYENICHTCHEKLNYINKYYKLRNFRWVYSIFQYNRFLRQAILDYKYYDKTYYSRVFSRLIIEDIGHKFTDIDYMTVVPIYKDTYSKRGYNQVLLIAEYMEEELGIKLLKDLIIKNKKTKSQHFLDKIKRKENIKGAFSLNEKYKIKDKKILIIDDIITTGSTLEEAASLFSDSKRIYGLSLASAKDL